MGGAGEELIVPEAAIETERLLLEPVTADHSNGLYEATAASQAELLPWMPWAREPALEATRLKTAESMQRWQERSAFHFAMIDRATGMVLGVVGLDASDPEAVELHYWIRTDHSGRGLTTEACRALIQWARQALHARRLWLWAGSDNAASRRVAEKLGFVHRGPLDWKPEGGLGTFHAESYELEFAD